MKTGPRAFPQEIESDLISYLKRLQRKGIKSIYLGTQSEPATDRVDPQKEVLLATPAQATDVSKQLAQLNSVVADCQECGLYKGRTRTVFGIGSPAAKAMFIGEGPGREEDVQGKPFVGRSGQLLTKMLAAIDLAREDVYITNIVKCRPPDNRDPQEEEVRCCEQYLVKQIELIRPVIICALGRIAAHWLLDTKESLASLRGSENSYHGTPVLVTYHPAALLRNPSLKKGAWEDFKRLRSILAE